MFSQLDRVSSNIENVIRTLDTVYEYGDTLVLSYNLISSKNS